MMAAAERTPTPEPAPAPPAVAQSATPTYPYVRWLPTCFTHQNLAVDQLSPTKQINTCKSFKLEGGELCFIPDPPHPAQYGVTLKVQPMVVIPPSPAPPAPSPLPQPTTAPPPRPAPPPSVPVTIISEDEMELTQFLDSCYAHYVWAITQMKATRYEVQPLASPGTCFREPTHPAKYRVFRKAN
jgi:hypothetical protein